MASSIGSQDSVSFLLTIQATGLLTFTLVGLAPTEYASLRWTHQHAGLTRRTLGNAAHISWRPHEPKVVGRRLLPARASVKDKYQKEFSGGSRGTRRDPGAVFPKELLQFRRVRAIRDISELDDAYRAAAEKAALP